MASLTRQFIFSVCFCSLLSQLNAVNIVVSIPPYASIAARIAGDRGDIVLALESGENHEHFDPSRSRIERLVAAEIFWGVGMGFEKRMLERIHDAGKGTEVVYLAPEGAGHDHDHDHDHGHHHHGAGDALKDPHIWLDPLAVIEQTEAFVHALVELDPEGRAQYEAAFDRFKAETIALDQEITEQLSPYAGASFFVYHAAFGVFAQHYGLVERSLEVEGKEPSAKVLGRLIAAGRAANVQRIYVQPGTPQRSSEVLAEALGVELMVLDPLMEDWARNLRVIADTLVEEFKMRPSK